MDNINMRYKAMYDGMAKTFKEDSGTGPVEKLTAKGVGQRPKTALPRELAHK